MNVFLFGISKNGNGIKTAPRVPKLGYFCSMELPAMVLGGDVMPSQTQNTTMTGSSSIPANVEISATWYGGH